MNQQPTLSVVMTNYNHGRFLPESLGAILAQSFRPKEIIIIDDASTDNSVEIIEAFARKEPIIRFLQNKRNMGAIYNANRLLKMASGDYFYGASADDKILPIFFEKSLNLLAQHSQSGLCSTLSRSIDEAGNDKGVFPSPLVSKKPCFFSPQESSLMLHKYGSWIKGNTAIYRHAALIDAGGYIEELGSYCDAFAQHIIGLRHGVCFVPEPLACLRELPMSFSATNVANLQNSLKFIRHARKLIKSTYSDIFPSNYIDKWERRLLWSMAASSWYNVRGRQDQYLLSALNIPGYERTLLDAFFKVGLDLSIRGQALVVMLYWAFKFRPLAGWLFRRWRKRAKTSDYPSKPGEKQTLNK